MKKIFLTKIMFVCAVLGITGLFLVILNYRNHYFEGKASSVGEFTQKLPNWKKVALEFLPKDAKNIKFRIYMTGYIFDISFDLTQDEVEKIIQTLSWREKKTLYEINQNSESYPFRGGHLVKDGISWTQYVKIGKKEKEISVVYDKSRKCMYLCSK